MRRLVWLLLLLCACSDEVVDRAATQITVRIQGSLAVQRAERLTIQVAPFVGGEFVARQPVEVALAGLDWPVDVPVLPGKGQSADGRFEVVVRALEGETALAEARAITRFVRGEQRVLTLNLIGCGATPICQIESCHGPRCLTCVAGSCEATPEIDGAALPRLDPDVIPDDDPVEVADAGRDGDADGDAGACREDEAKCEGNLRFECRRGAFALVEECDAACVEGACVACREDDLDCDGLQPRRCDAQGSWQDEGTPCASRCAAGICTECEPDAARCSDNIAQVCSEAGVWVDDQVCRDLCSRGACRTLASCMDEATCGNDDSCCTSHVVEGGSFFRSYDGDEYPDRDFPATVSSFRLDKYEVTVGRFRRWLAAYGGAVPPAEGAGKNPNDTEDLGWRAAWNAQLPATPSELTARLGDCPDSTWTDVVIDNEDKPINCVTWFEAYAFCIWDRGRLPTEAEWNYAASGGSEQRVYPWSTTPEPALSPEFATYYPAPLASVGSTPAGDGRWQQADLGGNVQEWVLDWFQEPYGLVPCVDCSEVQPTESRGIRGGAYAWLEPLVKSGYRSSYIPELGSGKVGFRCAREE